MGEHNTWPQERLSALREMMRRLIGEEEATRAVDPVRAAHIADAIADLRTLIARLEMPPEPTRSRSDAGVPPACRARE